MHGKCKHKFALIKNTVISLSDKEHRGKNTTWRRVESEIWRQNAGKRVKIERNNEAHIQREQRAAHIRNRAFKTNLRIFSAIALLACLPHGVLADIFRVRHSRRAQRQEDFLRRFSLVSRLPSRLLCLRALEFFSRRVTGKKGRRR